MQIDMRGFKVIYENSVYVCVSVVPMYRFTEEGKDIVERLRVHIINHEAQFDILEGETKEFGFLKDPKFAP